MTGIIEKIRKEIERLHGNPYYMMAIKDVLSIIDSLQEEPEHKKLVKCIQDFEGFGKGKIYEVFSDDQECEWITDDNGHAWLYGYYTQCFKLVEEPTFDDFIQEGDKITVNEDGSRFNRSQLERVIARQEEPKFKVKYAGHVYDVVEVKEVVKGLIMYGIEDEPGHIDYINPENCERLDSSGYGFESKGASYPSKSVEFDVEEPVSEELEEVAEKYAYTNWQSDEYHDGADKGLPFDAIGHTEKSFKAGAKWMLNKIKEENEKNRD